MIRRFRALIPLPPLLVPSLATAQAAAPAFQGFTPPALATPTAATNAPLPPPFRVPRPLGWVGKQFRTFGEDGWDVVTFWDEFDRREALLFAGVLGVGGVLLAVDEPFQEMVERNTEWGPLNWLQESGEFFDPLGHMGKTNKYHISGMLIGALTGWDALERVSREILFSHYIAAVTRQSVRSLVGRRRPFEERGAYAFAIKGGTSFPSGHASSIFQVASLVSDQLDWWPASVALYTMAGVVSYERIASGSHWPSDVWIGALWGWGVAHIVLRNAEQREEAEERKRAGTVVGVRLTVAADPWTGSPALQLSVPVGGPGR